jgi:transposase
MAYRYGQDRRQMMTLPPTLDQYVSQENPVRAFDAFVEKLDLVKDFGMEVDEHKVGNSSYDPRSMLKLLVFAYSYGLKSSRRIEREVHNNLSFIWLLRGLKPDHKTISEFRRKNKRALKKALTICAKLCLKLGLIDGNVLFVDGAKMRANAGMGSFHKEKWYRDQLEQIDKRIESILAECEQIDDSESGPGSFARMPKELRQAEKLKESVEKALAERDEQDKKAERINRIDPQSVMVKGRQGTHCGYNMQNVVDDKNGLIVSTDVVSESNDRNQLAAQIHGAGAALGVKCEIACGDADYWDVTEIAKVESDETKVVVPTQPQASNKEIGPFEKSRFTYDAASDSYLCPGGKRLNFIRFKENEQQREYRIAQQKDCRTCPNFGICTSAKRGRTITRHALEGVAEAVSRRYQEPEIRQIYDRRKARIEHAFGFIKKVLGFGQFSLRGVEGAQAEASILATCFNLRRMITLLGGVSAFIAAIEAA